MLSYYLPSFLDYLSHHYHSLYTRYAGRLIELFPSCANDEQNLVIVPDVNDTDTADEQLMQLWRTFRSV